MCTKAINHVPSLSYLLHLPSPLPQGTYFTVLTFIFNSKDGVQRSLLNILCFGQFNSLCYSPLSLSSHPPLTFTKIVMFSTCTDSMYFNIINSNLTLFPFPSLLSSVVPRLQTCFTCKFAYDHACFCVYIYLLEHMRENIQPLSF
jgi:hypothetical protein